MEAKEIIAKRIAQELKDGDVVNLGIGLPLGVANYIPNDIEVYLQSENGIIGLGPLALEGFEDNKLTNAGAQPSTLLPHGAYFDTVASFDMIRGGHLDLTILGALEVDEEGSLASWIIPGKLVPGMGGAMDLAVGAKRVIIATTHTNRGVPKIRKKCLLPITAYNQINMIVTELCVIEVKEDGLHLIERHPDVSIEEIISKTEAYLHCDQVKVMKI